jgi:hypothetical protein
MLKLWGYVANASCKLCPSQQCTLHHILAGCKFSLDQGRYTWRHDSVLAHIEAALLQLVAVFNKRKPINTTEAARKTFKNCFVRKGEKPKAKNAKTDTRSQLSKANDWEIVADFEDRQMVFPPTIYATNLRPDIVIWSKLACEVILIELTVCAEEGVTAAQVRKEARYTTLMADITATNSWNPTLITLEIGARGLIASRTYRAFVNIGFTGPQANKLCKSFSSCRATA